MQCITPSQHNINYKAGISNCISAEFLNFKLSNAEKELFKLNNINADFKQCKPAGYCYKKALDIFNQLKFFKKYSFFIPNIRVFDTKDLLIDTTCKNFCIASSGRVLKNEDEFQTGSIFQIREESLDDWNSKIETIYNNGNRSSNHFLSDAVHEVLHAVFIKYLHRKYGQLNECINSENSNPAKKNIDIMKLLEKKCLNVSENNIVNEVLGKYATTSLNQYHEIFAETFTKLICENLSQDAVLNSNPFEKLKAYPPKFLEILTKVLNI